MRLAFLLLFLAASPAFADKFLGVEEAPPSAKGKEPSESRDSSPKDSNNDAAAATVSAPADVHGNAVIGGSRGEFSGHVDIGYYFNRFMSLDLVGEYLSYRRPSASGEQYGPELDAILHVANPLPITPFFGAGLGYQEWRRVYDGEAFDRNHSATGSLFGGLQIRFTKFFGLQAQRRRLAYLETSPVGFDDRMSREPRSSVVDQVGFVVMF